MKTRKIILLLLFMALSGIAPKPVRAAGEPIEWHEVDEPGFSVEGFYWYDQEKLFRRLPAEPNPAVYYLVSDLAWDTAGGQLHFQTDSAEVWIDVDLGQLKLMGHMAPTGSSGFDLYAGPPGEERFVAVAPPPLSEAQYTRRLFPFSDPAERKMRSFIINFPLYNPVKTVRIGLTPGAKLLPPAAGADSRPIAIYGTSITQGACASRPGSAVSNILSRRLGRPVLNFGFSSCGGGEVAVARHLAQIKDPAMFIFDCEANAGEAVTGNVAACIAELRKTHPTTPILWVSGTPYSFESYDKPRVDGANPRNRRWSDIVREQAERVRELREAGDTNLYFMDGGKVWGSRYCDEATVDGAHPNDYGFFLMAEAWEKTIRDILKD